MKKEFNLSEKRRYGYANVRFRKTNNQRIVYPQKDVKEFIQLLKEEFISLEDAEIGQQVVWERKDIVPIINKLAGDKLISSHNTPCENSNSPQCTSTEESEVVNTKTPIVDTRRGCGEICNGFGHCGEVWLCSECENSEEKK